MFAFMSVGTGSYGRKTFPINPGMYTTRASPLTPPQSPPLKAWIPVVAIEISESQPLAFKGWLGTVRIRYQDGTPLLNLPMEATPLVSHQRELSGSG